MRTLTNQLRRPASRRASRRVAALAMAALVLPVAGASLRAGPGARPSAVRARAAEAAGARLESITTRGDGKILAVLLELSKPVPYAASQPDPLTVLLELRGVSAAGTRNQLASGSYHPIAALTLEQAADLTGTMTARVRVRLAETLPFRIRSERNVIRVEFDRAANGGKLPVARPTVLPPSPPSDATAAASARQAPPSLVNPAEAGSHAMNQPSSPPSGAPAAAAARQAPPALINPAEAGSHATNQPPSPPSDATAAASARSTIAPASASQAAPTAGQKQYTGNTISMDFGPAADLRAVLRVFGDQFGLNLLIDPGVKGTVDVQLRDVPWDQALDIILRSNQLGWSKDGNIVRIAPLSVLAEEEASRRKLAEEQALGGELGILTRTLSYAKADEMKGLLEKGALTRRGQAQVDARTNTLIIRDLPVGLKTAAEVMDTLDTPQPQVEIEARIVQTTSNFARQLGAQLGVSARAAPELANTLPFAFPNSGSITGRAGPTQGASTATNAQVPTAVNLAANPVTSALGLALGSVNGALTLDAALSALEKSGKGRVLSTPRVFAQNNVAASIMQGVQIPLQTVANNTITVTFKDAALTLKVTPQINVNGTVIMQITVENASPDYTKSINNIPPIDTQKAETQVMVRDGQTAVLGGIYMSQQQVQNERTPGLGKIPVLGWLFKRDTIDDQSRELLIFITPKIVKGG